MTRNTKTGLGLSILAGLALAGCATLESELAYQTRENARSQDPAYLSGFSDGCTSGYAQSSIVIGAVFKRDEARMRQDLQYAKGWSDGRTACNYPGGRTTFLFRR